MAWENRRTMTAVHTQPIQDLCPHEPSPTCWCRPRVREAGASHLPQIIHNSLDKREAVERLDRQYRTRADALTARPHRPRSH